MYQEDIWEKIAMVCATIMLMFMVFLAFVLLVLMGIKFWGWLW